MQVERAVAGLSGPARVLILACRHGAGSGRGSDTVEMPCVAMIPPSLIDYVISRNLADGVVVAGCAERSCYHRLGVEWTKQRFVGTRDPYLRARVTRDRLATIWASPSEQHRFQLALAEFRNAIVGVAANPPPASAARKATATKAPEPTEETVP